MFKLILRFWVFTIAISVFFACQKDDDSGTGGTPPVDPLTPAEIVAQDLLIDLENLEHYANPTYPIHYDANILAQDNAPAVNEVSDIGATLGRVLFYDKKLSINNTISCASCHKQSLGFTDEAVKSVGFDGGLTEQHSMRLANTNFYTGVRMFWDKRAVNLEVQSTQPIKDMIEMGFDADNGGIDSLIRKMESIAYYPILFEAAFGSEEITEPRMQAALSQFIRSMVSTDSKFDRGFEGVFNPAGGPGAGAQMPFANFTAEENLGKSLYLRPPNQGGAGCAGCHTIPTFALAGDSHNNGLDADEIIDFKSPSLKNIAVTGPYMHDGRFSTLEEVIEHYNSGIQNSPSLDGRLVVPGPGGGKPIRLNLEENEKQALVAFLHTLTDDALLTDSKFADPFK